MTESWYDDLGLISDDAPQFKIFGFVHGLCWVHGERKIDRLIPVNRLIPVTDAHRAAQEQAQSAFWEILSLKKTCRKLGLSFRDFLRDRLTRAGQIPQLAELMRSVAKQSQPPAADPQPGS